MFTVSDHIKPSTVRFLHEVRPSLRFACCEWMAPILVSVGVDKRCVDVMTCGERYEYGGGIIVEPVHLTHDVDNCGWKIRMDGERAIYATDTGTMDGITAKDYDLYMIEANYTEADMAERIKRKTETGVFLYEYRAAAGHLSREQADAWLAQNATPGKSQVIYLHQHHERMENQ